MNANDYMMYIIVCKSRIKEVGKYPIKLLLDLTLTLIQIVSSSYYWCGIVSSCNCAKNMGFEYNQMENK